jgi:GTP cyclohydrolase I
MHSEENIPEKAIITRFPTPKSKNPTLKREEKIKAIEEKFRDIMQILGLDLEHPSLQRTPYRIAKMYVDEVFTGLDETTFPTVRFVENEYSHSKRNNLVFVKVNFNSFCEHHFVPMTGVIYVGYIPNKKIIGLSKIPRIVRFFSQRPQIQERLGAQIADSLQAILETEHIAVCIIAKHFCMVVRGIEDSVSHTVTHVLRGDFETDSARREEFYKAMDRQNNELGV